MQFVIYAAFAIFFTPFLDCYLLKKTRKTTGTLGDISVSLGGHCFIGSYTHVAHGQECMIWPPHWIRWTIAIAVVTLLGASIVNRGRLGWESAMA